MAILFVAILSLLLLLIITAILVVLFLVVIAVNRHQCHRHHQHQHHHKHAINPQSSAPPRPTPSSSPRHPHHLSIIRMIIVIIIVIYHGRHQHPDRRRRHPHRLEQLPPRMLGWHGGQWRDGRDLPQAAGYVHSTHVHMYTTTAHADLLSTLSAVLLPCCSLLCAALFQRPWPPTPVCPPPISSFQALIMRSLRSLNQAEISTRTPHVRPPSNSGGPELNLACHA